MAQGNRVFLKRRTESRGGYFSHQSRQTDSLMWKECVCFSEPACVCAEMTCVYTYCSIWIHFDINSCVKSLLRNDQKFQAFLIWHYSHILFRYGLQTVRLPVVVLCSHSSMHTEDT